MQSKTINDVDVVDISVDDVNVTRTVTTGHNETYYYWDETDDDNVKTVTVRTNVDDMTWDQ